MIGKEEAYKIVDKYLIENVGNLIAPGEPVFDRKVNVWVVSVFHKSKVATFPVAEIVLDADGKIIHAPPIDKSKIQLTK